MTILIGLSSLPFLHELIIDENGLTASWVPNFNIEHFLKDINGKVLGYSKYPVFLYFLIIQVYTLIAWLGWFSVSKNRTYRYAILMGVLSSSYHIFLILSNNRKTDLNGIEIKLAGTFIVCCILFFIYFYLEKIKMEKLEIALHTFGHLAKRIVTPKIIVIWLAIFLASTSPYIHDIITLRGIGVKDWVPQLGIENYLTQSDGYVWGFNSYRVFLLTLSLQIFAQIGWAGWLHDSVYKLYRPFLVVPVALSLYQIVVILLAKTETTLNKPSIKLVFILAIGSVICYFYFFKNKRIFYKATQTSKASPRIQTQYKNN